MGATTCFECGNNTTSSGASTRCVCSAGYSGLPQGYYRWRLHGIPPFSAKWLTGASNSVTHPQEVFRLSASCKDPDLLEPTDYCGAGQTIHLVLTSPETGAEWSADMTIAGLPLSVMVMFNGSGFYFATARDSLREGTSTDTLLEKSAEYVPEIRASNWSWLRLPEGRCRDEVSAWFAREGGNERRGM